MSVLDFVFSARPLFGLARISILVYVQDTIRGKIKVQEMLLFFFSGRTWLFNRCCFLFRILWVFEKGSRLSHIFASIFGGDGAEESRCATMSVFWIVLSVTSAALLGSIVVTMKQAINPSSIFFCRRQYYWLSKRRRKRTKTKGKCCSNLQVFFSLRQPLALPVQ